MLLPARLCNFQVGSPRQFSVPGPLFSKPQPPFCQFKRKLCRWSVEKSLVTRIFFGVTLVVNFPPCRQTTERSGPDPDDALMVLRAGEGIDSDARLPLRARFARDIQTLNERATRGELDITAVSLHAYAYVSDQYALLPAARAWRRLWPDARGPEKILRRRNCRKKKIRRAGTMTSASALAALARQSAKEFDFRVVAVRPDFQSRALRPGDIGPHHP